MWMSHITEGLRPQTAMHCPRHDGPVLWDSRATVRCFVCKKKGTAGFPPASANRYTDVDYRTHYEDGGG